VADADEARDIERQLTALLERARASAAISLRFR
jgi:hypothetical protein